MRFFLHYVNPILAVIVLVICLVAASTSAGGDHLTYSGFLKDPLQTYFLAKGIFCAAALFLLGKLVEHVMLIAPSAVSREAQHNADDDEMMLPRSR
jgi:hypothetical protein